MLLWTGGEIGLVEVFLVEEVGSGCFPPELGWVTNRVLGVGGWKIGLT